MTAEAPLVTGVDFVVVPAGDLEASCEFYGEVLGLEPGARDDERGFAEFETGNLTLSVIVPEKMGLTHQASPNAIALHVVDMPSARARLEEAGVSFHGETFDTGVCFMSFFADPSGNELMLHHRYAPRAQ